MKNIPFWLKRNLFPILDIIKVLGIAVLLILFIHFNTKVAENAKAARDTADSTKQIVSSQSDILNAIKKLATDDKITSEQKTNLIICMLQVPVDQRTTDLQAQCRKQIETGATTYSGNTPSTSSSQPTTSQPVKNTSSRSSQAPSAPKQNVVQRTRTSIMRIVNRIRNLL